MLDSTIQAQGAVKSLRKRGGDGSVAEKVFSAWGDQKAGWLSRSGLSQRSNKDRFSASANIDFCSRGVEARYDMSLP